MKRMNDQEGLRRLAGDFKERREQRGGGKTETGKQGRLVAEKVKRYGENECGCEEDDDEEDWRWAGMTK